MRSVDSEAKGLQAAAVYVIPLPNHAQSLKVQ